MNTDRLLEIIAETTVQLRKGKAVAERRLGNVAIKEVFAMPHVCERGDLLQVDLVFISVGVDQKRAAQRHHELVAILTEYEQLRAGPSYIAVGAEIGDQGAALALFALGQVLGFWKVITPRELGFMDETEIRDAAGRGYIMVDGFRP